MEFWNPLIKESSHDFRPSPLTHMEEFQSYDYTKNRKKRARVTWQTTEATLKIAHLSQTFLAAYYTYQPQFSEQAPTREGPGLIFASMNCQHYIVSPMHDLQEVNSDPFVTMQAPFPLAINSSSVRGGSPSQSVPLFHLSNKGKVFPIVVFLSIL